MPPASTPPYPYSDAFRTRWESLLCDLNGQVTSKTTAQTLYGYVKEVSLGRCRLGSVTPQHDDASGRVAYLTLPGTRGPNRFGPAPDGTEAPLSE